MTGSDALLVVVGGMAGAPCRFLLDDLVQRTIAANHPRRVPLGTLLVNLLGSIVLGVVVARTDGQWLLLLGTGFCGAFTTFSTFAALTDEAAREGFPVTATLNIVASVVLCLSGYWLAWSLAS